MLQCIYTDDSQKGFVPHNSKNIANNGQGSRTHKITAADNENCPDELDFPRTQFVASICIIAVHCNKKYKSLK